MTVTLTFGLLTPKAYHFEYISRSFPTPSLNTLGSFVLSYARSRQTNRQKNRKTDDTLRVGVRNAHYDVIFNSFKAILVTRRRRNRRQLEIQCIRPSRRTWTRSTWLVQSTWRSLDDDVRSSVREAWKTRTDRRGSQCSRRRSRRTSRCQTRHWSRCVHDVQVALRSQRTGACQMKQLAK